MRSSALHTLPAETAPGQRSLAEVVAGRGSSKPGRLVKNRGILHKSMKLGRMVELDPDNNFRSGATITQISRNLSFSITKRIKMLFVYVIVYLM